MRNQFLHKILDSLQTKNPDLSVYTIVLPGRRPAVFMREILQEKKYTGLLPQFLTIEELFKKIAGKQHIQGIALWLLGFDVYHKLFPKEEFSSFLKWFPTLIKDWDDILKFTDDDAAVLSYMLEEERIRNWGQKLDEETPAIKKNLDFWRRMNHFLPVLKKTLADRNYATTGMLHELVRQKAEEFAQNTDVQLVFCGFNAFTPVEKKLVRTLLQWDKAQAFFHADAYYVKDERQEAGAFMREHLNWKEWNDSRGFRWVEDQFSSPKNIEVYEVPGNIAQTKVLPEIFKKIEDQNLSETAVVLLDENLLPASLDALSAVKNINITMGFPLKNLSFSNAVKKLFHLHKQLEKNASTYYYADVIPILEELPKRNGDREIIKNFTALLEERNIVYISKNLLNSELKELSYFEIFKKPESADALLSTLITFCAELKFGEIDDIQFENISHFERSFKILKNQLSPHGLNLKMDTLEVLVSQLVNTETIDFQGEPLRGLQIMGLLETRLLNFKNIILLSVNEGKIPVGNSQNTYLPFDVRRQFGLNTFLENDSIYAYHFYRLLQDADNVFMLYNALSSGVNTGEKSRFITQLEIESSHTIKNIVIENDSEPISDEPVSIVKTPAVIGRLEEWKKSISASHFNTYLYNPVNFYLNYVLKTKEGTEIEEELSQRNYGTLVHYALQKLYEKFLGKIITEEHLLSALNGIDGAMIFAIEELKHQPEFYEKGINFIHRSMAAKVVESILKVDLDLVQSGQKLEIIALEKEISAPFYLDAEQRDKVNFRGFIDRIDRLDGNLRIIDYKTARPEKLKINVKAGSEETALSGSGTKQALQLSLYAYMVLNSEDFNENSVQCGIWSFAQSSDGVNLLSLENSEDIGPAETTLAMKSVKTLISEILNPNLSFSEVREKEEDQ